MTTIATEQEQWAAAINDGCDSFTLLAYADWLEERGDETARAWRWFADNGKQPDDPYRRCNWLWYWLWWTDWPAISEETYRGGSEESSVPIEHAAKALGSRTTRFAAYEAAALALIAAYPNTEIPRP